MSVTALVLEMARVIHIHFHTVLLYLSKATGVLSVYWTRMSLFFSLTKENLLYLQGFLLWFQGHLTSQVLDSSRYILAAPYLKGWKGREMTSFRGKLTFLSLQKNHFIALLYYGRQKYPHASMYMNFTWLSLLQPFQSVTSAPRNQCLISEIERKQTTFKNKDKKCENETAGSIKSPTPLWLEIQST